MVLIRKSENPFEFLRTLSRGDPSSSSSSSDEEDPEYSPVKLDQHQLNQCIRSLTFYTYLASKASLIQFLLDVPSTTQAIVHTLQQYNYTVHSMYTSKHDCMNNLPTTKNLLQSLHEF